MKQTSLTILLFILLSHLYAQTSTMETDPHRGIYVNGFLNRNGGSVDEDLSILSVDADRDGIYEKEDSLLVYAQRNHITYLLLYDLHKVLGQNISAFDANEGSDFSLEWHLCRFIVKARDHYCISQIGAALGGSGEADAVLDWNELFESPTAPFMFETQEKNESSFPSSLLFVEQSYAVTDSQFLLSEIVKFYLRASRLSAVNGCSGRIDYLSVEMEWWNEDPADVCSAFESFKTVLYAVSDIRNQWNDNHPVSEHIFVEAYANTLPSVSPCPTILTGNIQNWIGVIDGVLDSSAYPYASEEKFADRVTPAYYYENYPLPGYNFDPLGHNHITAAFTMEHTKGQTDIHQLFSLEQTNVYGGYSNYCGPWLNMDYDHNIFLIERDAYDKWRNSSTLHYQWSVPCQTFGNPRENNIQPGGIMWYAYRQVGEDMQKRMPVILTSNSPVCVEANTTAMLEFEYIGPIEPGIDYEFWIEDLNNNNIVYPTNQIPITGTSTDYQPELHCTTTQPRIPNINFQDQNLFPACSLAVGQYRAHLVLHYDGMNGCEYPFSTDISVTDTPRITAMGPVSFCEGENVTLIASGDETTSSFQWKRDGVNIPNATGIRYLASEAGSYTCEISNHNVSSCNGLSNFIDIEIYPNPPLIIGIECLSGNDFQLSTSPDSGLSHWAGMSYLWETGETSSSITVTANSRETIWLQAWSPMGCHSMTKAVVEPGMDEYTISISQSTASDDNDCATSDIRLTANISPPPGNPNLLSYLWSNGATTSSISNLIPGVYSVIVSRGLSSCANIPTHTVTGNTFSASFSSNLTDPTCFGGNDGSIVLSGISGGTGPYTLSWNFVPQASISQNGLEVNGLAAGTYQLIIQDAGCEISTHLFTLENPDEIDFDLSSSPTSVNCHSDTYSSVTLQHNAGSGGVSPYTYFWSTTATTQNLTGALLAGSYVVTVTDANGCSKTDHIDLAQPHELLVTTVDLLNPCAGSSNGEILLAIEGGTPFTSGDPYSVGPISSTYNSTTGLFEFENLSQSSYQIIITDANGCIENHTVNFSPLAGTYSYTAPCIGDGLTQVEISASGGNPPYTGTGFFSVMPGTYNYLVTDQAACSVSVSATVLNDQNCCDIFSNPLTQSMVDNAASLSSANFDLNTQAGGSKVLHINRNFTFNNCTLEIAKDMRIIVHQGYTLTLNNSLLKACGPMWNGIINDGGIVVVNNSSINNAITAIHSSNGNPVRVSNSVFDQNFISISLNSGSYPPGSAGTYIHSSMFKCTGGQLTGYPGDLVISRPNTHIDLNGVSDLVIGNVNQGINNFFTAKYAIFGKISSFQVVNSNFDYSQGGQHQNRQGSVAIYGLGEALDKEGGNIQIGGPGANEACIFNFWETGIFTDGVGEVFVLFNYLNDCQTGSSINRSYHSEQLVNSVLNFTNGLGVYESIVPEDGCFSCFEHQVSGNYFNLGFSYQTDPFAETAVDVQHSLLGTKNPASGGTVQASGNYINNARIGIHIRNVNSPEMADNTYTTDVDEIAISDMHYGIWCENSNYANIMSNHMQWFPPLPVMDFEALRHYQRGITLEESYRCEVRGNVVTGMATGIAAKHNCEGSELYCNRMDECLYGVFFDESSPTSYLSTQGIYTGNQASDETWKNEWVNNLLLKVGGTIWSGQNINWVYDPSMSADFDPNPSASFVVPREGDLQNSCFNGGTPEELLRNEMFGAVAGDSIKVDYDSTEFVLADKEAFLVQVNDDPGLLQLGVASDAIYQAAFQAIRQSNSGKYEEVKTLIVDKDLQQARQKLAAIQDENLIDENKKTIASILLSLYDPALDEDTDTLAIVSNIALQHPFYGGEAVYWSRGILRMNVRDVLPPMRRRKPLQEEKGKVVQQDLLYPNPATQEATYTTNQVFKKGEVLLIKDNTGREAGIVVLPENLNSYRITIGHLESGLYTVTRLFNNQIIEGHKLVILK